MDKIQALQGVNLFQPVNAVQKTGQKTSEPQQRNNLENGFNGPQHVQGGIAGGKFNMLF